MTVQCLSRPNLRCIGLAARRRALLLGCAFGTTLALVAVPERAAAQAFDATPATAAGSVVYDRATPGVETVTVESPTAIIEWRPPPGVTPPEYLFLPGGNTATFQNGPNNPDFVVLNRIISTLPARFDGTVLSRLTDALGATGPGGTVLFSSPGGIILGPTALFDVGNLVLTSLNVVDDGGTFVTAGGGFQFDGGADQPNAAVITELGSQIIATAEGSYIAMVAPRVIHAGSARVNGSIAYVAVEEAEITVDQGLFDIVVTTGSDNPNPIVHSGVTGGPASTGGGDNHRVYMMAVPKNQAITALLSGSVGFDAATDVTIENGAIILSAGYRSIFDDLVSITDVEPEAASFLIQGGTITSDLTGYASTDIFASGETASLSFSQDVSLFGGERARLFAANGQTVSVGGDALVSAVRDRNPDPTIVDVTGGEALAYAESGGILTIAGGLTVDASGFGSDDDFGIGDGTGGTARLFADGGSVVVTGDVAVIANGTGASSYYSSEDAGSGFGGTASAEALNQGSVVVTGDLLVRADGFGGGITYSSGALGEGTGGSASVLASGEGSVAVSGRVEIDARGFGGSYAYSYYSGSYDSVDGAIGRGGSVVVSTADGGEIDFADAAQLFATGVGSAGAQGGAGGAGEGGSAVVQVDDGRFNAVQLDVTADGIGGGGGIGTSPGSGTSGPGGDGGQGTGGQAIVEVGAGGTLSVQSLLVHAAGEGGAGGVGSTTPSGGAGGAGGVGVGGVARAGTTGGSLVVIGADGIDVASIGSGGQGGTGGDALVAGEAAGDGGDGGAGTGGTSEIVVAGGSVTSPASSLDSAGLGGAGGSGGSGPTSTGGVGADADGTGGLGRISVVDAGAVSGAASLGATRMTADGVGGSGAAGAGDTAGRLIVEDLGTAAGGLEFAELVATSSGTAAAGGPAFEFESDAGPVVVAGDVSINVAGDVSFAATGSGGLQAGGAVSVLTEGSILLTHAAPAAGAATVSGADIVFEAGASIVGSADSRIVATDQDVFLAAPLVDVGFVGAARDVLVDAGTIGIVAAVAGRDIELVASGDMVVGFAEAGDDFRASAGGSFAAGSIVTTGLGPDSDGDDDPPVPDGSNIVIDSSGDLRLDESDAAGAVRLASAGGSVLSDGLLGAGTMLDVSAAVDIAINDADAGGPIVLDAGGAIDAGALRADGTITATAPGDVVIAGADSGASILVDAGGAADLGTLDAEDDIEVAASSIGVTAATAGGDILLDSAGGIAVGSADAGGSIMLDAGTNIQAGSLSADGIISAVAPGTVTIGAADGGSILVDAGLAADLGALSASQDIDVTAAVIALDSATAGGAIVLTSSGGIDAGDLSAGGALTAQAGGAIAIDSADSAGSIVIAAGGPAELGSVDAALDVDVTASAISIGDAAAGRDLALRSSDDLRLEGSAVTRNITLVSTAGSVVTAGSIVAGGTFAADAAGDFSMDAGASIEAQQIGVAAAGDGRFRDLSAVAVDLSVGGSAAFAGNVDAETISVASADIEIEETGSLGSTRTQLAFLTALDRGQQTIVGGSDQGPGYTLTNAEAGRITAATLRIQAPQNGTDAGREPDLQVRDLSLTGQRIGTFELLTTGILEVAGAVLLADARADGGIALRGVQRLQIVTPDGSVRVRNAAGMPTGSLTLESGNLWAGSRSLIDRLIADPNFDGRNDALLTNDGPVEPRGYIEAGDVSLFAGDTLFVQNSGGPGFFAGITVLGNTLRIVPTGDDPLVAFAFGRRINADGSFVSNSPFFFEVVFDQGSSGYTDESELNRCIINTRVCPAGAPELDFPEGRSIISDPVDDPFAELFGAEVRNDLVDTSFSAEPLIEEPVTSGGDSVLWDCDTDGDGDCDEDDLR